MRSFIKSSKQYQEDLRKYCLDVSKPWLLAYWADALGVTVDALLTATAAVGTNLNEVDAYLAHRDEA
jgi:hypothetical protein